MDVGNAASPPGAGAALAARKNRLRRGRDETATDPSAATNRIEPIQRVWSRTQKELLMHLLSLFSAHFWLLFALAVSIAVFRELRREPNERPLRAPRRKNSE
jgi:hypothetical protein